MLFAPYAISLFRLRHAIRLSIQKRLPEAPRNMSSQIQNASSAMSNVKVVTTKDGEEFAEVQEGLAKILIPAPAKETTQKGAKAIEEQQKVFYNPIQQFNRDLTVLAIKAYGEGVVAQRQAVMAKRTKRKQIGRAHV